MNTEVGIKRNSGVKLPEYATELSAGVDLQAKTLYSLYSGTTEISIDKLKYSILKGYFSLRAGERAIVGTGIFVEVPEGFVLDVRSRSGNAAKKGLVVANSPGTIDPDYRGEIKVILHNTTKHLVRIDLGDNVAQAVLLPFIRITWKEKEELSETVRGEGGLGSTDKK